MSDHQLSSGIKPPLGLNKTILASVVTSSMILHELLQMSQISLYAELCYVKY